MLRFFSMVLACSLLALACAQQASKVNKTTCPEGVKTIPDFDPSKYLGYWYNVYSNINSYVDPGDSCSRATYQGLNDTFIYVRNVGYTEDGQYQQVCGIAWQVDPENEPGHLVVQFRGTPGEYLLLDTDYASFAAVYSCTEKGLAQTLLTRSNTPDIEVIERGLDAYRRNGLDTEIMFPIPHENCLYDNPDIVPCDAE